MGLIRLPGEISVTSDKQMTPPYGRKWRETIEPLDESEREECKSWFKTQHSKNLNHGIRSHHFKENRWEKVEAVTDFIFLGFKITTDSDYNHEIKRCLLLRRKLITNLGNILKSRDINLPAKVHLVKAMDFQESCMDRASLRAQLVKNLPAMQETWVWLLHWENPLEKEMATHSNILAWRIPWTEEPGRLQSMVFQRSDRT